MTKFMNGLKQFILSRRSLLKTIRPGAERYSKKMPDESNRSHRAGLKSFVGLFNAVLNINYFALKSKLPFRVGSLPGKSPRCHSGGILFISSTVLEINKMTTQKSIKLISSSRRPIPEPPTKIRRIFFPLINPVYPKRPRD